MDESLVVLYRSVVAFVTLLIYARILGKQQVTHLTFFEYVTGITIGSIASSMSVDLTSKAMPHFVGLSVWFLLPLTLQYLSMRMRLLGKLITGEPVILIHNGKILDKNMRILRYTVDELLEQLRIKNVFDLGQVEFALLETNGQLSVQMKSQNRPLQPKDLQLSTEYEGLPTELILDGKIQHQNLENLNLNAEWLIDQLHQRGIPDPRYVFLGLLNPQGELYLDLYQDRLKTILDISDFPGVS